MKKLCVIVAVFMSLLVAAKQSKPLPDILTAGLSHIDTLMQNRPDSALMMLMSADSVYLNNDYYQLLLAEALYKTGNRQINRYKNETVKYFDSLAAQYPDTDDVTVLSARSHYMNGVGYYENDSVVEACNEYLNTLDIMESHFDENELVGYKARFMSLTHGRLGELFSDQFMMQPAIESYKKALFYCQIEPTSPIGISNLLFQIGKHYDMMNETDSASYYYNKALVSLNNKESLVYRDIVALLALLNYHNGSETEISIDSLKTMAFLADDYDEVLTRYFTIGGIMFEEQVYDSAQFYLNIVFDKTTKALTKLQSAEFLYKINKALGDEVETAKFAQYLALNKSNVADNKSQVSLINNLYNDYQHKKHDKKQSKVQEGYMTITIIIIMTFLLILVIIKKRNKKNIEAHKKALTKAEENLTDIKMKVETQNFTHEPICQKILSIVKEQQFKSKNNYIIYKDYALNNGHMIEIREVANLHYNNFTIRLKEKYPQLTNDDIDYCCLYLLGLKEADVSALMQKDYSSVCYRSRKIKSIIKSKNKLADILYNLALA